MESLYIYKVLTHTMWLFFFFFKSVTVNFYNSFYNIGCLLIDYFFLPGLKYENENEQELKDKMDFPKQEYTHYPAGGECWRISWFWREFEFSLLSFC